MSWAVIHNLDEPVKGFLWRTKQEIGQLGGWSGVLLPVISLATVYLSVFLFYRIQACLNMFAVSYVDVIGSAGIAWYALRQREEALEKARTDIHATTLVVPIDH